MPVRSMRVRGADRCREYLPEYADRALAAGQAGCVDQVPAGQVQALRGSGWIDGIPGATLVRRRTVGQRCDEPVAAPRGGHDEAVLSCADAEGLAQRRDGLAQVVFLDHPARPCGGEQLVLADGAVALLDQVDQDIQRLGRDPDRFAIRPVQFTRQGVQPKAGKLEQASVRPCRTLHRAISDSFRFFCKISRTPTAMGKLIGSGVGPRQSQACSAR